MKTEGLKRRIEGIIIGVRGERERETEILSLKEWDREGRMGTKREGKIEFKEVGERLKKRGKL